MIDVIANRYAEALFQIGEEENKTDNLYNELKEVSSLITTNNELNNVMKSPLVSKKEKIQLIDTLFAGKIDNDLKNFLKILIEKGRITSISAIEATYKGLLNEKNNILEGYVISAVPMDNEKIKELETELSKKYNKNAGQIILRWIYQEGVISLPKSTNEERMKGNIDIFDFELTDEEMKNMQALDTNKPSHNPEDPANETRLMGLKIHD